MTCDFVAPGDRLVVLILHIVTPRDGAHVSAAYPDWEIVDSDDGMTYEGGTSYLLERRP